MAKSNDEVVNGPKVAAEILNKMRPSERERLVQSMKQAAPEVTKKVEANLISFEDIAELTPQGIQLLIKEVDHRDLVISLRAASQKVSMALYNNMSARKRQSVAEDLDSLPEMESNEIEESQHRILKTLDTLRTQGKIRSESKSDVWV